MLIYYAISAEGYKRGPYRATRAEAESDCPMSGRVLAAPTHHLLKAKRIQWDLVDRLYSSEMLHRHDGIEQVWLHTTDLRIMDLAQQALRQRDRGIPWR